MIVASCMIFLFVEGVKFVLFVFHLQYNFKILLLYISNSTANIGRIQNSNFQNNLLLHLLIRKLVSPLMFVIHGLRGSFCGSYNMYDEHYIRTCWDNILSNVRIGNIVLASQTFVQITFLLYHTILFLQQIIGDHDKMH